MIVQGFGEVVLFLFYGGGMLEAEKLLLLGMWRCVCSSIPIQYIVLQERIVLPEQSVCSCYG